jgi:Universal stress protein family
VSVAGEPTEETGSAATAFDWPRYPRILVPIDETAAAAFALRHVVPYAVEQRSRLTLLTVVPKPPRGVIAAGLSPDQLADEMETEAATQLREVAATLPQELSVTTLLRHGDPAEEILALLREQPFRPAVHGGPRPGPRHRRATRLGLHRSAPSQPGSRDGPPSAVGLKVTGDR